VNLVKSTFAVIASVLILFAFAISNTAAEKTIIGDVDGDGEVTVQDATVIQRALANMKTPENANLNAGDVDNDGEITSNDVTLILRYKAGLIPSLPFGHNVPTTAPTTAPTVAPTVFPTDPDGWGQIIYRP
jgi:hypothetical protein